jgi:hypothetical protein
VQHPLIQDAAVIGVVREDTEVPRYVIASEVSLEVVVAGPSRR